MSLNIEEEELYLMIEMCNPRAGDGQDTTVKVYRAWIEGDVKYAACGVPHPKENTGEFREQIQRLCNSFQLNT